MPNVRHIFLENSPCIRTRGLDVVIQSLKEIGFLKIVYCLCDADESVGAFHKRRRWFCIATRDNDPSFPKIPDENMKYEWDIARSIPNVVPCSVAKYKKYLHSRTSLLGNSVIPQCVAFAYSRLTSVVQNSTMEGIIGKGVEVTTIDGDSRTSLKVPRLSPRMLFYVVKILDSDDADVVIRTKKSWGTPTYSRVCSAKASPRGSQNYAIQVYHARET